MRHSGPLLTASDGVDVVGEVDVVVLCSARPAQKAALCVGDADCNTSQQLMKLLGEAFSCMLRKVFRNTGVVRSSW